MKKLNMATPDLTRKNIDYIEERFPNVISESENKDGKIKKVIDFDLLRQVLSDELVDDDSERYRLDWPGKKASLLKANTPITKTLRPDRESSVNFDTTENVFIEGDNFEVLKVLQESYLGKIKMIYIDPPYNTGKDFVYKDNFTKSKDEYDEDLGVEDEEGGKLFRNTDTNGRFHSDWLSMMYERLIVARDLLKDDGIIFISIDDNEITNLRKLCDEIFGESNFVAQIVWQNKEGGGGSDSRLFKIKHEYILCYGKSVDLLDIQGVKPNNVERYTETDKYESTRGRHLLIKLESGSLGYVKSLDYPISTPDGTDINPNQDDQKIKRWRWSKTKYEWGLKNDYVVIKKDQANNWGVYTKQYLNADNEGNIVERRQNPIAVIDEFSTTQSAKNLAELFGGRYFDYPKPVELIKWLLDRVVCKNNDIVLDFFAGSATVAHAILGLNAEDGINRKFIAVQIPEQIEEESEAYKAGYKYISEISKERIRRAGKKILEENAEALALREKPLDIGFRAYKADTTNMKDVYYHPSQVVQEDLFNLVSNIKEDRTPEDLLTQVILDLGLTLDLPIEKKELRGNAVYFVAGNALVACFDDNIDFDIVDEIAKSEPLKVVFKDASFKEEQDRTNVDTRMKRLSPETIITVL